jgi:hypothetical protein
MQVRKGVCDWQEANRRRYEPFLDESFDNHIAGEHDHSPQ